MGVVMIYLFAYVVLAVILISVITLIALTAVEVNGNKTAGRFKPIAIVTGMLVGCLVAIWICSHRTYPLINDWAFLGKDIKTVEQNYGGFERCSTKADGSGYAVLMTEQIVGRSMYDSNEYSCYHMEFDQTGKIVKVYCSRPVGG